MFTEQEMKEYGLAPNELKHYGVVGMKWGVRKYQNEDGTLTAAGKARYARSPEGLGFKPLSGKRGDIVQRAIGKQQITYNKKAAKMESKRQKRLAKDNGIESAKSLRLKEKGKMYSEMANFRKQMQKTYSKMADSDRNKVKAGLYASNVCWALGMASVPFVSIWGSAVARTYSTNKLINATDSKNGWTRYRGGNKRRYTVPI